MNRSSAWRLPFQVNYWTGVRCDTQSEQSALSYIDENHRRAASNRDRSVDRSIGILALCCSAWPTTSGRAVSTLALARSVLGRRHAALFTSVAGFKGIEDSKTGGEPSVNSLNYRVRLPNTTRRDTVHRFCLFFFFNIRD